MIINPFRAGSISKEGFIQRAQAKIRRNPAKVVGVLRGAVLCLLTQLSYLFFPNPRVIRGKNVRIQRRFSLQAEAPGSKIIIGDNSIIYESARLLATNSGCITVGENSIIGPTHIYSASKITIGARFLSSWNVVIQDYDPHPVDPILRAEQVTKMVLDYFPSLTSNQQSRANQVEPNSLSERLCGQNISEPITIGDDVWIGVGAIILKGVNIGNGSIVAAGSVVTSGTFPDKSLIAGNPAKIVKSL